jgi:hypothetical protein
MHIVKGHSTVVDVSSFAGCLVVFSTRMRKKRTRDKYYVLKLYRTVLANCTICFIFQ